MNHVQRMALAAAILVVGSAVLYWKTAGENALRATVFGEKSPIEGRAPAVPDISGEVHFELDPIEPTNVDYQGVLDGPGQASRVSPTRALPSPSDGRLKLTLDDALQKARAGDSGVASQLARELTSCKHRLSYLNKLSVDISVAQSMNLGESVVAAHEEIALAHIKRTAVNQRCDGITEADMQAIPELLELAVNAGELNSIGAYIEQGLTQPELLSYLREPERFRRFRDSSVRALEAGVRQCFPPAMTMIGDLYRTGLLLPRDPVRGLGYELAQTWAVGANPNNHPMFTGTDRTFTAGQLNQAIGFAHQIYGRYCQ